MSRKEKVIRFWNDDVSPIDLNMVLVRNLKLESAEKKEILSKLPPYNDLGVLELGGGVGRFTGAVATGAKSVISVDIVSSFLEETKNRHRNKKNIQYIQSDVMDLNFEEGQFDFIFFNWLMMYLEDEEVLAFRDRILRWLKARRFSVFPGNIPT